MLHLFDENKVTRKYQHVTHFKCLREDHPHLTARLTVDQNRRVIVSMEYQRGSARSVSLQDQVSFGGLNQTIIILAGWISGSTSVFRCLLQS